jgi:hypothetical protein
MSLHLVCRYLVVRGVSLCSINYKSGLDSLFAWDYS